MFPSKEVKCFVCKGEGPFVMCVVEPAREYCRWHRAVNGNNPALLKAQLTEENVALSVSDGGIDLKIGHYMLSMAIYVVSGSLPH